ncbi:DUF5686 and carboxypeptidase-like regulatory domain-containing protein [Algivirga pacifica]
MTRYRYIILFLINLYPILLHAQEVTIKGRVLDKENDNPIAYAHVFFKGATQGATTDFNGNFVLEGERTSDTLRVTYIGYEDRELLLDKGQTDYRLTIKLTPTSVQMQEVVVSSRGYENPAWEILRKVVDNKKRNNLIRLKAYEYESYTRNELNLDNITEKFKKKKVVRDMIDAVERGGISIGEDGKPILPIFVSETISKQYFTNNPKRKTEFVERTKVTGVGVDDGSVVSQITGATFLEYNFYENWVGVLQKDFVSPIAESWKLFYDYELDFQTYEIDGIPCTRIKFEPKREQDLAFSGSMWITDEAHHYALKRIDVVVGKQANLNFVEQIRITQELIPVEEAWLPSQTRITLDIGEINDKWGGFLAKSYVANSNFVVNKERAAEFYSQSVRVREDAYEEDLAYNWDEVRQGSLTEEDMHIYQMIDTLKNLPRVKTLVDIVEFLINGYVNIAPGLNLGTYSQLYAYNDIEDSHFQVGFTTDVDFSRDWLFKGHLGYGIKDDRFKYDLSGTYFINRRRWMQAGIQYSNTLEQVGIYNDDEPLGTLFTAASRWGNLVFPFYNEVVKAWYQTDFGIGMTARVSLKRRDFDPLFPFEFINEDQDNKIQTDFTNVELVTEWMYAPGEKRIKTMYNTRIVVSTNDKPRFGLRYTYGIPDFLGSDFEYHKFQARIWQGFRLGAFGRLTYELEGGYILDILPFPLLETHQGNELAIFYSDRAFNLMRFGEFVSDRYASLRLEHNFAGMIMNRVPLFRRLKWRLFATANTVYGSLEDENREIVLSEPSDSKLKSLEDEPYTEVGYGVENIFKVLRVDFIHRLTQHDDESDRFGVKLSAKITF